MNHSNPHWPVRPRPLPDELFSSWLYRAARANGQKLHTLCDLTVRKVAILNRDIDKSITLPVLQAFAHKLNTPTKQALGTTLASYEGLLYEKHNPNGDTKFILPLGIYHRDRKGYGQQYCPECLATDKTPYYRKAWRLAFNTVCATHRCRMLDRCPDCKAPVVFFKNELKEKNRVYSGPFTLCHQCGFDLSNATRESACKMATAITESFNDILKSGFTTFANKPWIYAHSFFAVARQLTKIAKDNQSKKPLKNELEHMSLNMRYERIAHIAPLLLSWPQNLIRYCQENKITKSLLTRDFEQSPYWFQKSVDTQLSQVMYTPNEREVQSAIQYLAKQQLPITKAAINRLMGYGDSKTVAKVVNEHRRNRLV